MFITQTVKIPTCIAELSKNPTAILNHYQDSGVEVIGYTCSYVPEELILSGGMQPYRIPDIGGDRNAYTPSFVCPFASATLDNILRLEHMFSGFVLAHTCDPMWRLYDILKKKISKPLFLLRVPHNTENELSLNFFRMEIIRLRTFLEENFHTQIDDDALSDSIKLVNESRDLLRNIYMLNSDGKYANSGFERFQLVLACMWMPKADFNNEMKKLNPNTKVNKGLRLHLTGTTVYDLNLIRAVEEAGGFVASDDLCTGSRYFWTNVKNSKDPILALSRRYLGKPPCPSQSPLEKRLEHIRLMTNQFKVQGVLTLAHRFCDPTLYDSVHLGNMLETNRIPHMVIEYENPSQEIGRIKTRVEAFIESMEE